MSVPFDVVNVVIYLGNDESPQHITQDIIIQALKDSWSTGQTMRHYAIFFVATWDAKSSLPLITFIDVQPVIGITEVKLCEDFGTL